jgi:hypothetical protein
MKNDKNGFPTALASVASVRELSVLGGKKLFDH